MQFQTQSLPRCISPNTVDIPDQSMQSRPTALVAATYGCFPHLARWSIPNLLAKFPPKAGRASFLHSNLSANIGIGWLVGPPAPGPFLALHSEVANRCC